MLSELQQLAHRLEQQIVSFEKLHADEMQRFQVQFEVFQRLQNDELKMLRDELTQLKDEIARLEQEAAQAQPQERGYTLSRRDFLTGNLRPPHAKT